MDDLKKLNLHISVWDKENGRPDEYIGTKTANKKLDMYFALILNCGTEINN